MSDLLSWRTLPAIPPVFYGFISLYVDMSTSSTNLSLVDFIFTRAQGIKFRVCFNICIFLVTVALTRCHVAVSNVSQCSRHRPCFAAGALPAELQICRNLPLVKVKLSLYCTTCTGCGRETGDYKTNSNTVMFELIIFTITETTIIQTLYLSKYSVWSFIIARFSAASCTF
jgi:hypothetical protein